MRSSLPEATLKVSSDALRYKRFVRNSLGSSHPEATLKVSSDARRRNRFVCNSEDAIQAAFHSALTHII
jgi:hypothetical protein